MFKPPAKGTLDFVVLQVVDLDFVQKRNDFMTLNPSQLEREST